MGAQPERESWGGAFPHSGPFRGQLSPACTRGAATQGHTAGSHLPSVLGLVTFTSALLGQAAPASSPALPAAAPRPTWSRSPLDAQDRLLLGSSSETTACGLQEANQRPREVPAVGIGCGAGRGGPGEGGDFLFHFGRDEPPGNDGRRDKKGCDSFWEAGTGLRAPLGLWV